MHFLGVHRYFWWWWWWQRIQGRSAVPRPNEEHERVTTPYLQVCVRCGLTLGRLSLHFPPEFHFFFLSFFTEFASSLTSTSLPCIFTSFYSFFFLSSSFSDWSLLPSLFPLLSSFYLLFLLIQVAVREGLLPGLLPVRAPSKGMILNCICGWHQIGWKESESWSNVAILNQEVDLGKPTSFLDHVHLVGTQRQCDMSKDIVDITEPCLNPKFSAKTSERLPSVET